MRHLLSPEHAEVLAQFAFSRVLVAFDFDGTLAPIVERRSFAKMRPKTRDLFSAVCERFPCAVISGRARADIAARLGDARVKYVVGNHGLEPGAGLEGYKEEMHEARARLEAVAAREPGIDVEDKRYSLAIHYRRSRQKRRAREAIVRAVSRLRTPMRIVPGRLVVNVLPARAPNKGDALLELRTREGCDTAIYVGDDVTDEDVFDLDQPGRLLTIRIGASAWSSAAYFLRDQRQIDRLLARLVALRQHVDRR